MAGCIIANWSSGLGDQLMRCCGLEAQLPDIQRSFRLVPSDIARREFDLITAPFHAAGRSTRLVLELKDGGIGYRSIAQVLFYKHVLCGRHWEALEVERLVFALVAAPPHPRRSDQGSACERDALEFARLLRPEYWPDEDIHLLTYPSLGLKRGDGTIHWSWAPSPAA